MNEYMIVCDLMYPSERFIWHCKAKDESEAMSLFYKEHDADTHDIDYIIKGQHLKLVNPIGVGNKGVDANGYNMQSGL